jgi:hypothetical protein
VNRALLGLGYLKASQNKPHTKANRHFNPQITLVIENNAKTSARHGIEKKDIARRQYLKMSFITDW